MEQFADFNTAEIIETAPAPGRSGPGRSSAGIMQQDERILDDPAPAIALGELGDSSVNFNVRPWVNNADYWPVRSDMLEKVKLAFDSAGISIPYPQRDVHLHNAD